MNGIASDMGQPGDYWTICVGRWRGVELRIHILFPLLALSLFLLVPLVNIKPTVAMWSLLVLLLSVTLHELVRVITTSRLGGHTSALVLAPVGGCSRLHLPADPPAHLVAALVGPMTFLVLLIASACGLALAGEREVHRLLYITNPGIQVTPDTTSVPLTSAQLVGQLIVWINAILLLISLLPINPCAGAELLRGILWPIVGRATAITATSSIALGGALLAALLALVMLTYEPGGGLVPSWFPLGVVSCFLLYGGMPSAQGQRYDLGLAIDEFDSDDEEWLMSEWLEDDREVVLVEHLQDKQQEALDRKRKEREATEDARVDAILQRLHDTSFEQLSEEERAILKRASRRYRERQTPENDRI
ncbi:MAG: hypothetical protein MI725_02465 [Pirellulales bacterium]|nr:hypothetical protein [Pirellulales bacterium]